MTAFHEQASKRSYERKEAKPLRRRTLDRLVGFVSYLLILLPAVFGVIYVRAFGVNVVVGDAWTVAPLFGKWSSGTLSVLDLFRPHNEHRMFFPDAVELLLGNLTKYDNVAEMYLIQVCLLVTLVILLFAFKDNIRSAWLLLFVPVSLLIFSFRQYENMLFGYQINFAFAEMFGVLALFLLYVLRRRRFNKLAFAGALGSATVASFSVLQGLFVWPAGLLQLFISPLEKPKKRVLIVLWGLVGLGEWIVYFGDYGERGGKKIGWGAWIAYLDDKVERGGNKPPLLYALEHPLAGIEYLLSLLGSALFWQQNLAFVTGLLLAGLALISLALIYGYGRLGANSFWVSLLLYSFLTLAAITVGRSGFGVDQALSSRYATFSILAVVSVYAMLVKMTLERRTSLRRPTILTVLLVALSGAVLLSAAISYSKGADAGNQERAFREEAAFVLSTYESQPDEVLESIRPRVEDVRTYAPVLQRLGYNVFSEEPQALGLPPPLSNLSPIASSSPSAIDHLNSGPITASR